MLEWIDENFFCVDEKPPFYNINAVKCLKVTEHTKYIGPSNMYMYDGKTETYYRISIIIEKSEIDIDKDYKIKKEAENDLCDFIKSHPKPVEDKKNILID